MDTKRRSVLTLRMSYHLFLMVDSLSGVTQAKLILKPSFRTRGYSGTLVVGSTR